MLNRYLNPEEPLIVVFGFAREANGHCFLSYWAVDCIMPSPQLAALLLALLPELLPY